MKMIGLLAVALAAWLGDFNDIATINRLKQEAEAAFQQNNYAQAAKYYGQLVDSLQVNDEAVRLNLAHALLMAGDTTAAQQNYSHLTASEDRLLKSVALQANGRSGERDKKNTKKRWPFSKNR